ncbi:hypothetical protein TsFJ059_003822 [Trichoderma semiorbis]|uniref:Uncharacterized protein n=2 Tax=Trichoderma TaxID=5543 RepID=A0A2T3ZY98_TRIHA|nr:hypothetical protein M431DRAFT_125440 [Trichoderma harzianum CBS 226.95]KAH0529020.1 hypothetical protein TsFJ059_003822 [Trichoderma semiorbis]PTB49794.1 hypothetical protein M431DRAFT_125440 [Trichoderma harzianum CBS 226.95]
MPANAEARRERLLRLSTAQEQASGTALNQAQTQTQTQEQAGQNDQAHNQPAIILYYERGEGSGNVFRFRIGPDYYWIAGSGLGGSLTADEEEHFYRVMEAIGVERV